MKKYFLSKIIAFSVFLLITASCKKHGEADGSATVADTTTHVNLALSPDFSGNPVPDDFMGLSHETSDLTNASVFNESNTKFINLVKNIGPGVLRIGGNTVDQTVWSHNSRGTSTDTKTLFATDLDRFAKFGKAIGWKVLFGLPVVSGTPGTDADEAKYVSDQLGNSLLDFEIGNEADHYKDNYPSNYANYDYTSYLASFNTISSAVQNLLPGVKFSGPAVAYQNAWVKNFATDAAGKIDMVSRHYYRDGPASDPAITMSTFLTFDPYLTYATNYNVAVANAAKIPFRYSECNSIFAGGKSGISDALASSLWAVEFLMYSAQQGVSGVNFHGGGTAKYSPILSSNGVYNVKPLYYGLLMFKAAQAYRFYNLALTSNGVNLDAFYFLRKDGKKGVIIVNKEASKNIKVDIQGNDALFKFTKDELTGIALNSSAGVLLDGQAVDANGNWIMPQMPAVAAGGDKNITIPIAARSASLIVFN